MILQGRKRLHLKLSLCPLHVNRSMLHDELRERLRMTAEESLLSLAVPSLHGCSDTARYLACFMSCGRLRAFDQLWTASLNSWHIAIIAYRRERQFASDLWLLSAVVMKCNWVENQCYNSVVWAWHWTQNVLFVKLCQVPVSTNTPKTFEY